MSKAKSHNSHVINRGSDETFAAHYIQGSKLGKGNFATVYKCTRISDNKVFAVKVIKKHHLDKDETKLIHDEVNIMHKVNHPNCVKLYEIFDEPKKFYLILDLLSGGELFDRIVEKGNFSEREAADVIRDTASALHYLHDIGIVHRDLKPENLIYQSAADDSVIKLTDFGLAKFLRQNQTQMSTQCGTPGYVAPEVLMGHGYDSEVDMWSLGVILYIMLCGYPPFYDEDDRQLYKQIKRGDYDMPPEEWDSVSEDAKSLVRQLLVVDKRKRLTPEQVMRHPWIQSASSKRLDENFDLMGNLKRHNYRQRLRRAIYAVTVCNRFRKAYIKLAK